MQFCLLLFGAIACVALLEATPLVHHDIHKRQLEVVNAASDLICDVGVPFLEDKLENLNIPSFSILGVTISSIDVIRVDIGRCSVSFIGGVTMPRVRISLFNIYIEVTGRYKRKVLFFSIKGKSVMKINNGWLNVAATLEIDPSSGKITRITVNSCNDNFTDVSVRFHGSISAFIINLFRKRISRVVSKTIESKVCEVGIPFLENELLNNPGTTTTSPLVPGWGWSFWG